MSVKRMARQKFIISSSNFTLLVVHVVARAHPLHEDVHALRILTHDLLVYKQPRSGAEEGVAVCTHAKVYGNW